MKKTFAFLLIILLFFLVCETIFATTSIEGKETIYGVLTGEELRLSKDKSPYVVIGNVLIQEGDTLIIDPGVEIQVNGNYYIQVEGSVKANGTESEKIKFCGVNEINVVNNNDSSISYSTINGNYEIVLKGVTVKNCDIEGKVSISKSNLSDNELSGEIEITSSSLERNVITGSSLSINDVFLENNKILSEKFSSSSDTIKYVTFDGCDIKIGNKDHSSTVFNTLFSNCTFSDLSSDINESNFINCGSINTSTARKDKQKFNCTGNYWGDINTVEIRSKGERGVKNLSFITDYYDDFNRSEIDYSNHKETEINGIGYLSEGYTYYEIGDTGPAGGLVFYDKGYYSDGWRYLEAAPEDIGSFVFGYYRPDKKNNEIVGTDTTIGSGKDNTEKLVKSMGKDGKVYDLDAVYSDMFEEEITSEYAAKKCLDYIYGEKDDWFLPSKDELNLMYENLEKMGLGNFSSFYWSSSESDDGFAWSQWFYDGNQSSRPRGVFYYHVRAIRAF